MKKSQLFLILGACILLFCLYFGANTIPPKQKVEVAKNQPMPAEKASFDQIQAQAYKSLGPAKTAAIKALASKTDLASLQALSKLWTDAKQGNMGAKYKADAAKLENTEKSLTFASQYFIDLYSIEQEPPVKAWQAEQAAELLNKVVSLNPNNLDAKVKLAQCYTDGTGETMKGVLMLREVVAKDSNQLQAGLTLGRLAITSGQYDKSIARLEKLAKAYPKNSEVLGTLAEAFKSQGLKAKEDGETQKAEADIAKAKQLLNECKQIVGNPNFSKNIDEYIKTF
jgi:tetratricopeptide (TPR) repeat protein